MTNHGCYRDKTYCISSDCKNNCGRKITPEIEQLLKQDKYNRTAYAYFCGKPEKEDFTDD